MPIAVEPAQGLLCSPQQKELLSRFCSPESWKIPLPTYSMKWQLSSSFTSFDRFSYTWQAVASHHPVLRTSISLKDNFFDLNIRNRASRIQIQSANTDLARKTALETAELGIFVEDTVASLCLRIHYALVDRPSLARIRHDFDLFYNGLACEPHTPFKNYVSHIHHRDHQKALSFWRETMSGAVTSLTYGIPTVLQGKERTYYRAVDPQLLQDISRFCEAYSVSIRHFFHATWALVQYRHTAAADGTVVFAVSGRDTTVPECNTYVGFTEQLYPIKIQIGSQFSALDWIMQVSKVDRDSASNAFIGYERIAREILPLEVQVHLLLDDGLEIVEEGFDNPLFPLILNFDPKNGSMTATYHSNMDRKENLVFLVGHLITAMEAVVAEPRTQIGQIPIISKDEQAFLAAHSEPLTQPVPGLVHRLVEREAETTPDKEAINFEGQSSLTYAELNRLSNQVARQLKTKRGDNVPVCMDRSPYLIIALIAILKTGAAYVVLDPESPNDRCDFIVSDVQAPLVLTDVLSRNRFAESLSIEHLVESASQFEGTNLYVRQDPSDIVYIIYTSGSTGKPKGVILEHQAAFTGLDAFPELTGLRQLLFHNPVFSAAQRSIWSTLKQGGCLCLARKENLTTRISDMINRMHVNVIDVTPSTASLIDPESVPTLRRLTVAGELISPALLPIWMGRVELLNAYGLSEVTQINWRHRMLPGQNPQNIGRPVDSTRSYVLIPGTTQHASILEPGELCLGGHQLARSYLNRPKKTEESFLRNPFGPGTIYRTGDMVVTHPDGSIEMIGRIDFQVKINGQRVEPGEINYYLQKHAGVFDSCTASATVAGKKSLVAVVVPKDYRSWSSLSHELRQMLRQQLPSYMVPPYWLAVPELPLNINGKVDVPMVVQIAESTPRENMLIHYLSKRRGFMQSPLTSVQESMRATWSEALNIPAAEISLDDSFLDLGGSSLEAIMVTSSARARLIDVKSQDIMLQESLRDVVNVSREMASPLEQATIQPFSLLPKGSQLDRSSLEDAWPVTPSQEPLIADLLLGGTQYVYSKILRPNKWGIKTFKAAIATLIKRNALLRSTFIEHGSTYLQLIQKQADLPWEMSSKSLKEYTESGESQSLALGKPFCRLVQTKSGELVVTFHHALFDYWSSRFFHDDIAAIINQKPLPERPFYNQYVRYISEQDESKSQQFWRSYLQGAQATLLGDPKRRRPELVVTDTGVDLHSLSKDLGIPMGSLVYAAWATVLSFETGLTDLTFAATFSGRDIPIPDILRMYGPTVTSVPIRIHIEDKLTLSEVGKAVQFEVMRVSEHTSCGLRTILRASGQNSMLFNTAVNFLLRPTSDAEGEFDFLDNQSSLVSDHIKLEVDSQYTGKLSLTSSLGNAVSHSILDKITTVFKCFERQAETLVGDIFSKLRPSNLPWDDSRMLEVSQFPLAHSLFEKRATTHSFKVAIANEHGEELTYQQLNEKANQLATFLRGKGVRLETVIPLYLDKSLNTLIGMLGIWKAGAAFCALDPVNPPERNALILRELKAMMVITDKANVSGLVSSGVEAVILDELNLDAFDSESISLQELNGQNLAYILYTSGSTGTPKGVMITHGSVAAASQGMIKAALVTDEWRSLWALNYIFDGSYFDVFPLLGAGGTLFVVPQQVVFSDIAGYINRLKVTHLNVTPTIARTFTPDDVPDLKVLIVGGEPLHQGILDIWANRITVYNNYGPTEGTVMVTTTTVTPSSSLSYIGAALPSAELTVRALDSEASLPQGETGELCISGPHVSRGYLDRPEANKAAFFTDSKGRLVYRTGDLARLLPDGGFELGGRKDDQVKVNGYRIELGEIETAVQNTMTVEGCVVLAPNLHQKRQLVACCKLFSAHCEAAEANSSRILDPSALDSLKDLPSKLVSLAHYMMPAVWLPLAEFPLLPSGKIDRKSLSKLVETMDSSLLTKFQAAMSTRSFASEHADAQSSEEEALQAAWGAVFDKEPSHISTLAAFHALGGDSIAAINLVSACRRRGYKLAVADVMAYPTIQMQAKRLCPLQSASNAPSLADAKYGFEDRVYTELSAVGIEHGAVEAIYPCLPGQSEFLTQGRTEHQFWQLMTVRKLPLNFDLQRWTELVTALTARNQILRAIFLNVQSTEDPEWVQAILKDPILDLDTIFYQNDDEKQKIIDSLWENSFAPNKPAVQYRILTSSINGSLDLYIKLDHGMYDGTLLRIFDEQFIAMATGLPLPPLTEFNQVIHHYVSNPAKKMLDFWTSLLAGARFQWPSNLSTPKINHVLLRKTGLETNSAARRTGVTPPIIFQTAWSLLLGVLARTTDVVYDNLLTGRNLPLDDPQAINGNCANFLPFRSQFPAETRLLALMHDTQSLFWETTNNGLVGLADISKALGMSRAEAAAKTMFCFQPFDPPPQGDENDMARHMRWIVMAMSSNRMFFNYAFMCEVFKAPDGYKVKFQYDGRALGDDQAGWAGSKYLEILAVLNRCGEEDTVRGLWKAIGLEKDLRV